MPKFRVLKGHDAYAVYAAIIEAENADEANDVARADIFADIWEPNAEVREFDAAEVFGEETTQIDDDETAAEAICIRVTARERNTILAALRLWKDDLIGESPDDAMLEDIASDGGRHDKLTDEDIDTLCERINS